MTTIDNVSRPGATGMDESDHHASDTTTLKQRCQKAMADRRNVATDGAEREVYAVTDDMGQAPDKEDFSRRATHRKSSERERKRERDPGSGCGVMLWGAPVPDRQLSARFDGAGRAISLSAQQVMAGGHEARLANVRQGREGGRMDGGTRPVHVRATGQEPPRAHGNGEVSAGSRVDKRDAHPANVRSDREGGQAGLLAQSAHAGSVELVQPRAHGAGQGSVGGHVETREAPLASAQSAHAGSVGPVPPRANDAGQVGGGNHTKKREALPTNARQAQQGGLADLRASPARAGMHGDTSRHTDGSPTINGWHPQGAVSGNAGHGQDVSQDFAKPPRAELTRWTRLDSPATSTASFVRSTTSTGRTIRYQFNSWTGEPAVDVRTDVPGPMQKFTVSTSDETVANALSRYQDGRPGTVAIQREGGGQEKSHRHRAQWTQDDE